MQHKSIVTSETPSGQPPVTEYNLTHPTIQKPEVTIAQHRDVRQNWECEREQPRGVKKGQSTEVEEAEIDVSTL